MHAQAEKNVNMTIATSAAKEAIQAVFYTVIYAITRKKTSNRRENNTNQKK